MGLTKQYLRYAHVGSFNAVGSSNGAVVAVDHQTCAVTACENVHFYNFRTGEKVASLSESEKQVTCLRLSHNKQFLAIGYADGAIRLFNRQAEDQNECIVFMGHKKGVNCLAFSHDGLTLASGGKGSDRLIDFYRVYTDDEARKRLSKKLRKAKRKAADSGADEGPSSEDVGKDVTLVFARVGEWRAAAKPKWISFAPSQPAQHGDGVLQYRAFCLFVNNSVESLDVKLNAATNEVVVEKAADLEKMGHRGDVRSMSVASHDSLLATGGGNQVMLWNVETFRAANCLQEEGMDDVTAVLFATGDRHVIAATK
ncbi:unnamed protein product, partial [Mesorhabditis spiculigera]